MVEELDAIKAEMKFREKIKENIRLDNNNTIIYANDKYWWDHKGVKYSFPISRVWCGAFMEYIFMDFTDGGFMGLRIRRT